MNWETATVRELEPTIRTEKMLAAAGIETVAELIVKQESELLKFKNFGRRSLEILKADLARHGLHLGMEFVKR